MGCVASKKHLSKEQGTANNTSSSPRSAAQDSDAAGPSVHLAPDAQWAGSGEAADPQPSKIPEPPAFPFAVALGGGELVLDSIVQLLAADPLPSLVVSAHTVLSSRKALSRLTGFGPKPERDVHESRLELCT